MMQRTRAAIFAACLFAAAPAWADNSMGYRLLSAQEASALPRNGGALGLDVERSQQITDQGMTFDLMRIKQVRRGSAGAQAGFSVGDQIIAMDGRVFPTIAAFAAYVGSTPPGRTLDVDYIPRGGGPSQAQRLTVTVGAASNAAKAPPGEAASSTGMSTGKKLAIGAGAAAILCYAMGCFSHKTNGATQGVAPAQ